MNAVAGKTVTFTVTVGNQYRPLIEIGQLVKIKSKKRVWGEVTSADEYNATLKAIYRPAPRSRLNNKSVFSRHKSKIIKFKTT